MVIVFIVLQIIEDLEFFNLFHTAHFCTFINLLVYVSLKLFNLINHVKVI